MGSLLKRVRLFFRKEKPFSDDDGCIVPSVDCEMTDTWEEVIGPASWALGDP